MVSPVLQPSLHHHTLVAEIALEGLPGHYRDSPAHGFEDEQLTHLGAALDAHEHRHVVEQRPREEPLGLSH